MAKQKEIAKIGLDVRVIFAQTVALFGDRRQTETLRYSKKSTIKQPPRPPVVKPPRYPKT